MVRGEIRRRKGHVAIIAIGRLILEEGGLWLVRLLRVVLRHEAVGECVLLLLLRRHLRTGMTARLAVEGGRTASFRLLRL